MRGELELWVCFVVGLFGFNLWSMRIVKILFRFFKLYIYFFCGEICVRIFYLFCEWLDLIVNVCSFFYSLWYIDRV